MQAGIPRETTVRIEPFASPACFFSFFACSSSAFVSHEQLCFLRSNALLHLRGVTEWFDYRADLKKEVKMTRKNKNDRHHASVTETLKERLGNPGFVALQSKTTACIRNQPRVSFRGSRKKLSASTHAPCMKNELITEIMFRTAF